MAYTDRADANYLGQLFLIGEDRTPFLTTIGSLNTGATTSSFNFPVAQPWNLSSASQATQSEATASAAGTPTTISRGQDYNTVQIMKKDVGVSYAKQSATGELSGLSVVGDQVVKDEQAFQKAGQFKQLALDIEYSFLQGSYVASDKAAATNQKTRGIIEAISTNTEAAAAATLTKAIIDKLIKKIADTNGQLGNMVCFVNSFQKQQISNIYENVPTDRSYGGLNIKTVETDFFKMGVVFTPQMPAATLLIADISLCAPVFCPHDGQLISYTEIGKVAALNAGFWYTQIGLNYGIEEGHGKITGLATS